jgi:hypothetical protein
MILRVFIGILLIMPLFQIVTLTFHTCTKGLNQTEGINKGEREREKKGARAVLMAVLGTSGGRLVSRMRCVPSPAISSRTVEISPDVCLYTVVP